MVLNLIDQILSTCHAVSQVLLGCNRIPTDSTKIILAHSHQQIINHANYMIKKKKNNILAATQIRANKSKDAGLTICGKGNQADR